MNGKPRRQALGRGGSAVLTGPAEELRRVPCPVLPAPEQGRAAREEAGAAAVPRRGADLVALLWFAEGAGVADGGGRPALHWERMGGGNQGWAPPNYSKQPPNEPSSPRGWFGTAVTVGKPRFGGADPKPSARERGGGGGARLTQPHFAGVGEVVVAGHVAPLAPVVPHDDHTVLPAEEVAVGLPVMPVLIELGGGHRRVGGASPASPNLSMTPPLGARWQFHAP